MHQSISPISNMLILPLPNHPGKFHQPGPLFIYPPGNHHISPPNRHFCIDDFLFPKVGYVSFLEGNPQVWRVAPNSFESTLIFQVWGTRCMREPATGRLPGQDLQPGTCKCFQFPPKKPHRLHPGRSSFWTPKTKGGWKKMFLFNLEILRFQPLSF